MIKKIRTTTALLLSVLVLFSPSVGICSPTYTVTADQLLTLERELNALRANNDELTRILNESDADLTQAREALQKSRADLETLKQRLTALSAEAVTVRESLQIANDELKLASESLKKSEQDRQRVEGRLRTQRNIWEALFFVACGVAICR